jgi:hypothetical protein
MMLMYVNPSSNILFMQNIICDSAYNHTYQFENYEEQETFFHEHIYFQLNNQQYTRISDNRLRIEVPKHMAERCNYIGIQNSGFDRYGNQVYMDNNGNPKWYYAFITGVEYLNEAVSIVTFQVDYIQTWYFRFQFQPCLVDRMHSVTDQIGDNLYDEGLSTGDYVTRKTHYNEEWQDLVPVVQCLVTADGVEKISYASGTGSSSPSDDAEKESTGSTDDIASDSSSDTGDDTIVYADLATGTSVTPDEGAGATGYQETYTFVEPFKDGKIVPFDEWWNIMKMKAFYYIKYGSDGRKYAKADYETAEQQGEGYLTGHMSSTTIKGGVLTYYSYWFKPDTSVYTNYNVWYADCKNYYIKKYGDKDYETYMLSDWQLAEGGQTVEYANQGKKVDEAKGDSNQDSSYEYESTSSYQAVSRQYLTNYSQVNGIETGCVHWCFPQKTKGNKSSSRLSLPAFMSNVSAGGIEDGVVSAFMAPSAFLHEQGSTAFYEQNSFNPLNDGKGVFYYTTGRKSPVVTTIYTDLTTIFQQGESSTNGYDTFVPRNKKLFTYPYVGLTVTGGASASTNLFRYEWFRYPSTGDPAPYSFNEYCSIVNGVKGLAAPKNYNGERINMAMAAEISDFPVPALIVDSYKSYLARTQYSRAASMNAASADLEFTNKWASVDRFWGSGGSLVNMLSGSLTNMVEGNVGGIGNSIVENLGTLISSEQNYAKTTENAQKEYDKAVNAINAGIKDKSILPMSVLSGAGTTIFNMVNTPDNAVPFNTFTYRDRTITTARAKQIDDFFTRYGYTYNTIIDLPTVFEKRKNRRSFTYIKTVDCHVTGTIPESDKAVINRIHDSGITYWADQPNAGDYDLDNTPVLEMKD